MVDDRDSYSIGLLLKLRRERERERETEEEEERTRTLYLGFGVWLISFIFVQFCNIIHFFFQRFFNFMINYLPCMIHDAY